jgi:hypothetical protein
MALVVMTVVVAVSTVELAWIIIKDIIRPPPVMRSDVDSRINIRKIGHLSHACGRLSGGY